MLSLKPAFSLSSFTFIESLLSSPCLSAVGSVLAIVLDLVHGSNSLSSEL